MFGRNRPGGWRRWALPLATTVALALLLAACGGEYPQSTIDPVTRDLGGPIQDLYELTFWVSMGILAVVWGLLAWVVIRYRERPGHEEPESASRGNLLLEIGWTLIPALIVVAISVPSIMAVFDIQRPAGEDALVVDVIGHQWWWEFRYPEEEISTANELHVPVGRTVELRLRSADVIHSFWIPKIGGKRDVNPPVKRPGGRETGVNRLVFTVDSAGVYSGQCAEFCGSSHGLMGMRLLAQPPEEFERWVREMSTPVRPDSGTVEARGRDVFMQSACIACHTIDGTNARGQLGPNLTRIGARRTLGAGLVENTEENLVRWIRNPEEFKPGVKMPGTEEAGGGMPPTGLSDEELRAVAAYLHSLR